MNYSRSIKCVSTFNISLSSPWKNNYFVHLSLYQFTSSSMPLLPSNQDSSAECYSGEQGCAFSFGRLAQWYSCLGVMPEK